MSKQQSVVIMGAGPAGLTAAYEATRRGFHPIVLEKSDLVGGLARTEIYKDYRFDIGGHRYYTKLEEIRRLWQEVLGDEFLKVPRLSHIYYRGRLFNYPLDFFNTLVNLGFVESGLSVLSYLRSKLWPYPQEKTFEQWVSNRFGRRLYRMFFQTYTEKVWGMPCDQIQAEWAAQRIKGLSLRTAVSNALFGTNHAKTLVNEFRYPALGSGMMWQRFQEIIESHGGQVQLGSEMVHLEQAEGRITGIVVRQGKSEFRISGDCYISTIPLTDLVARLEPAPPDGVIQAARGLRYRDFILVGLVVNRAKLFPDQWIYVHSPEVQVGRIQNYKNWSAAMVPDPRKTSLGLEYFCTQGDAIWQMPDADLVQLATRELAALGLANAADVDDGVVIRQLCAYPVYDRDYRAYLEVIRRFLLTVSNLQSIGRNGIHHYNNLDHSMLAGMLAIGNLKGENHNLWDASADYSYYEELVTELPEASHPTGEW